MIIHINLCAKNMIQNIIYLYIFYIFTI
uniref:Uncharacterized protein n=1 Tax=Anguilla anguilla TaxID=7936 RepID=A0A0E9TWC9_ANGAN